MAFGRQLAARLKPGDVVALTGDLGAGKTCLVKGLADGLGVTQDITSPTFTLIHECPPLAHVDLYRLDSAEGIGLEEYLQPPWITVIEWADKAAALLPAHTIHIRLTVTGENQRQIEGA